jgi:hypothetical protein
VVLKKGAKSCSPFFCGAIKSLRKNQKWGIFFCLALVPKRKNP